MEKIHSAVSAHHGIESRAPSLPPSLLGYTLSLGYCYCLLSYVNRTNGNPLSLFYHHLPRVALVLDALVAAGR